MRMIWIGLAAAVLFVGGVPAAAQEAQTLPASADDLRSMRAQQDGPIVKVDGHTCYVSRAWTYEPSCWPSRPEWTHPMDTRTAMVIGIIAASAFIGAGALTNLMTPAPIAGAMTGTVGSGAAIGGITSGAILAATE